MKKTFLFLVLIAGVAAAACYFTLNWSQHRASDGATSHEWLHHELNLTEMQLKALEPIEDQFSERQTQLAATLREANRQLARAMAEDKRYTPRVSAAVEHAHRCMGDLQRNSIEHVFAMRTVLTPEQGDRLLFLAQKALDQPP